MASAAEIRECLRTRTLAEVLQSVRAHSSNQAKEEEGSEDERRRTIHATHFLMEKFLKPEFLDRYLGDFPNVPLDDAELRRIKKFCKKMRWHTSDPLIRAIQRRIPSFTYRNGSNKLHYPLPNHQTLQVGCYYSNWHGGPMLRVHSLGELGFIGEELEGDNLFHVYYNLPGQRFVKETGGFPLAHSWDCERVLQAHVKRVRECYGSAARGKAAYAIVPVE